VHRIGRTGRAGKTGVAITLVDWDELARWEMIDKALNLGNPDPAETYSSSPHIYEDLDIPTDATGTVGKPAKRATKASDEDEHRISSADRPARTRTRSRRRTRGGKPLTGHPDSHPEAHPESVSAAAEDTDAAPAGESEAGEQTTRRRRRRRPRKTEAATAG